MLGPLFPGTHSLVIGGTRADGAALQRPTALHPPPGQAESPCKISEGDVRFRGTSSYFPEKTNLGSVSRNRLHSDPHAHTM